MRFLAVTFLITLALGVGAATAQPNSVRVHPGQVCADNKCVRFSRDLQSAQLHGRVPVSVKKYRLQQNPVISLEDFRRIFHLTLVQSGINDDRG